MEKKRYAHVGIGGRAIMYYEAIARDYNEYAELVGFCDINRSRMDYANRRLESKFGYHHVPTYGADEFEKMIEETKPDCVIVMTQVWRSMRSSSTISFSAVTISVLRSSAYLRLISSISSLMI